MSDIYKIEVKWNGTDHSATTSRTVAVNINRGRDGGPMTPSKVGICDLTMRNDDKRFTPEAADGALYGDLEPGKLVRVSAAHGRAVLLDGTSQYLCSNSADFEITGPITVGAWVKWANLPGGDQYIINKVSCYEFRYYHPSHAILWIPRTTGSGTYCGYSITPDTTSWWFLVGTYDGSAPKLYVNGELESTGTINGPLNSTATPLAVGNNGRGSNFWNGYIAYPFVSARAYDEYEVRQMYNEGAGYMIRDEHLRGYWTFYDQDATDKSGNGNDLTVVDSPTYPEVSDLITARLFTGYLDEITPNPANKSCTLRCQDLLGQMQIERQNLALLSNKKTGELINEILDDLEFPADDRIVDAGQTTVPVAGWSEYSAYEAAQLVAEAEHGLFYLDGAGWAVFEERNHRRKAPHTSAQWEFTGAPLIGNVSYHLGTRGVRNHIRVKAHPVKAQTSVGVVWLSYSVPFYIGNGGSRTFYVKYRDATTGKPMKALEIVSPVATTDYTANVQPDGGGADRTANLTVTPTVYAEQTKLVLTASANLYVTFLRLRGKLYEDLDVSEVVQEDAASQGKYGKRTFDMDNVLIQDEAIAEKFAKLLLARMKAPVATVSLEFFGHRDAAHRDAAINIRLSDRIDITDTVTGLDGASYFVEAIDHKIGTGGITHSVTLTLEPVVAEGYWILGVSKFSSETIVAF